jgi:hypothetical protein
MCELGRMGVRKDEGRRAGFKGEWRLEGAEVGETEVGRHELGAEVGKPEVGRRELGAKVGKPEFGSRSLEASGFEDGSLGRRDFGRLGLGFGRRSLGRRGVEKGGREDRGWDIRVGNQSGGRRAVGNTVSS